MFPLFEVLKFLHVLAFVFMAWPLYALISVNERATLGAPLASEADSYLENVIKGQTRRCYIFQLTVFATGVALLFVNGMGLGAIFWRWTLASKCILLLVMMGLLSYVHLNLQPRIDALFSKAGGSPGGVPPDLASRISALRLRRKKLAGICLFLVICLLILGVQVYSTFPPILTIALLAMGGLFSWRAFKGPLKYGWL